MQSPVNNDHAAQEEQ